MNFYSRSASLVRFCFVLCLAQTLMPLPRTAFAQLNIVESFDEIDRSKWRLPKAPISNADDAQTAEVASRYFRHADGKLVFVVPPNDKKREQFTVVSNFPIEGDFDLKVKYLIPEEIPKPSPSGYVNFEVMITGPDGNANLARTRHGKAGEGFTLFFRPAKMPETKPQSTQENEEEESEATSDNTTRAEATDNASQEAEQENPPEESTDPNSKPKPRTDPRVWRFRESEVREGILELRRRGSELIAIADGTRVGAANMGTAELDKMSFGVVIQGETSSPFEVVVSEVSIENPVRNQPSRRGTPATDTSDPWLIWLTMGAGVCVFLFLGSMWMRRSSGSSRRAIRKKAAAKKTAPQSPSPKKENIAKAETADEVAENIDDFDIT